MIIIIRLLNICLFYIGYRCPINLISRLSFYYVIHSFGYLIIGCSCVVIVCFLEFLIPNKLKLIPTKLFSLSKSIDPWHNLIDIDDILGSLLRGCRWLKSVLVLLPLGELNLNILLYGWWRHHEFVFGYYLWILFDLFWVIWFALDILIHSFIVSILLL